MNKFGRKLSSNLLKISLVTSLLFVASCGFHLRGYDESSQLSARFDKTYVQISDNYLESQIKRLINNSGGKVVKDDEAITKVSISSIKKDKRQIALSGDGSLKEYEQTYNITVTVSDISNGIQLGNRKLSTIKFIQLDSRKILAGEEQSDIVKKNATRELAKRVMSYLRAFH